MAERPSYLQVDRWVVQLDRARLAGLRGDPAWARHLQEVQRELPVPDWVYDLQEEPARRPERPWWLAIGLSVGAALALAVVLSTVVPRDPAYVGVKGDLAATIYTERGPWTGSPLPVGEPLRIELRGPPAPHYAVLLQEYGHTTLVSAGAWPSNGVVPGAWAFDAPPAPDAALIVLALASDPEGASVAELQTRARRRVEVPLRR